MKLRMNASLNRFIPGTFNLSLSRILSALAALTLEVGGLWGVCKEVRS